MNAPDINILKTYMDNLGNLSSEEWQELEIISEIVTIKTANTFIHENQRSFDEIFILEGVVRAYIVDNMGNDRTTAFYLTGNFISTNTLRTLQGLSIYNYQALTETKLIYFNSSKLKSFFSRTKILSRIGYLLKESEKHRLGTRDRMLLQINTLDKYKKFLEHYIGLENQVSHKYIASYLGITPVSFSRIRKKFGNI